ncbi:LysR substrate-binding domain-containing protein [Aquabacterium sp. OR-4]|uniref:LysR substrate-binding domain-containing protein n=1 Tax=Aquabacterium sp. OR-4 TaxID=2978127 RepID=UPI0021B2717A|nr:LysR substrate-binding domain-containing protein [Aquabacterium sp. OR-4]MDT7835606.1 LysR substrate-binding domain-containing protein [Aquabacterium sp. OR-4]
MRFDLVTLNLVLAIAETRSITRGAEREHLALAAASKRLSDLETRLGVALFERRARGVETTEAGRALVRHIRSLHASLHALESEVVEFSRGIKGHLRIAANAGAIAECLPADLAAFSQAHPGIRISLEDLTSAEVQAAVTSGRADVGIFVPPQHEAGLDCRPYRDGELAVLVPQGHALARQAGAPQAGVGVAEAPPGAVRFDALLGYDIVGLHLGAAVHEQMRERAQALGRTLNVRVQVRGFDAIAQLVEAGLGVAVLPAVVAQRFARIFAITPLALAEDWSRRPYLLAVRPQAVQPAVVQRFIDALCPPAATDTSLSGAGPDAASARQSRSPKR